jgi:hypothetical protein
LKWVLVIGAAVKVDWDSSWHAHLETMRTSLRFGCHQILTAKGGLVAFRCWSPSHGYRLNRPHFYLNPFDRRALVAEQPANLHNGLLIA